MSPLQKTTLMQHLQVQQQRQTQYGQLQHRTSASPRKGTLEGTFVDVAAAANVERPRSPAKPHKIRRNSLSKGFRESLQKESSRTSYPKDSKGSKARKGQQSSGQQSK